MSRHSSPSTIPARPSGCTAVLMACGQNQSSQRQDLVTAWKVRDSFGEHDVPSTLMGVTVLGYPGQLVETEAVAAVLDPARSADGR
jgi:hypothetical protein